MPIRYVIVWHGAHDRYLWYFPNNNEVLAPALTANISQARLFASREEAQRIANKAKRNMKRIGIKGDTSVIEK